MNFSGKTDVMFLSAEQNTSIKKKKNRYVYFIQWFLICGGWWFLFADFLICMENVAACA